METAATALLGHLASDHPLDAALLPRLLRAGHVTAFLAALSEISGLPHADVRWIILDLDGISLAILCRACGMAREILSELLALVHRNLADTAQLPGETRNSILAFYDRMTLENANEAVAFWRRDADFVAAVDRVADVSATLSATD